MTESVLFTLGAIVALVPLFAATYYRGLAVAAFRAARAFQPLQAPRTPTPAERLVAFFMSVNRGGGPEFFITPAWMVAVTAAEGRAHIATFKRHRRSFWLFMACLPGWFVLVSRLFWK
jgi:hypothetical protein